MRGTRGAVACALIVCACGASPRAPSASPGPTAQATAQPTVPPTPTPIPALAAPAIIQVENSDSGRPQSGLDSADLVYEYVAEGGVGRFSVFFFGPPPAAQPVGPVRSARTVTIQLGGIYQGYLAYSGASSYISWLLRHAPFPSYDEDSARGNLFRISSRQAPHNLYTDGQHIASLAAAAALPDVQYHLWPRTTTPAPGGIPITGMSAWVSPSEQPVFTWHAELGGFTRTESTGPVTNPQTGAPLVLPTVIVQQVAVTTDPRVIDVDGHLGVDQAITAGGRAEVFTGGREYNVSWTQPAHGPPQFTLADGTAAPIAPGEVWISLVQLGQSAAVTVASSPAASPSPR